VPTVADFDRLDARFRLPTAIWSQLPDYALFGFAVFKLKSGNRRIHPMAFAFPRALPQKLFFPTVHIHDGRVHEFAYFHHQLFCQWSYRAGGRLGVPMGRGLRVPDVGWSSSTDRAGSFVAAEKARGLLDADALVYHRRILGRTTNRDVSIDC
jgi:hypothetical protein